MPGEEKISMVELMIYYKLKKGVRIEDFIKYSREVDQPILNEQKGIVEVKVSEASKLEPDNSNPDFDIVENIFVESYERWLEIVDNDEMSENGEQWLKLCDVDSRQVYCKKTI